ncbi:Probable ATP synthase SpaL [Chromobacterium violaceum]|uniref:Probable ATP synthase SpaL n=1 Tax=Chromobacterium violaceum TaxID=536 RepID=A0A447TEK1_CHRVL|nr:Probable ATP synthase SpaL [Chromobacterium violaceum]
MTDAGQQQAAAAVRGLLARLEELQVFIDLGEYRPGENADNDRAMSLRDPLRRWLRQRMDERAAYRDTLESMDGFRA